MDERAPAAARSRSSGSRRGVGRDLYHFFLRAPWWVDIGVLSTVFVVANLAFADRRTTSIGGVANAHGFVDEFFYSVETMGTIGYGEMYPTTHAAHAIVTLEALAQIFLLAVTTGLVFAKFSIPRARVQFARHPTIGPYDGVPTLHVPRRQRARLAPARGGHPRRPHAHRDQTRRA